ncbi:hypothetical protein [Pseudomonas sp. MF6776]|uniref:hypothetical protein n=1 Tax=Pseudomonas sp. MF6776 TaxID=2797534 RepID=UPI001F3F6690|nr:hypothetical protein [Pseudomonas sp. MF6776]
MNYVQQLQLQAEGVFGSKEKAQTWLTKAKSALERKGTDLANQGEIRLRWQLSVAGSSH